MFLTNVPEVTFTKATLIVLVVLAVAAMFITRLFEPATGVTMSQEGMVDELLPLTVIVQFTFEFILKVSVQALLEGNIMLFLETYK